MLLKTTDIIAILIALLGSITVMLVFWRENVHLQKKVRALQVALRDERRK
jgi:hypothetical protein